MLLFNSDNVYLIGSALLKDYYAVYDIDSYQFALGKVIDFDAPPPPPTPNDVIDDGDSSKADDDDQDQNTISHDDLRNGLIFGGIALAFIIISCIICKRRRDADRENSGSQAARKLRKGYPLIEDDPNHSLTLGREYPSKRSFVEAASIDDEEQEDQEDQEEIDLASDDESQQSEQSK